MIKANTVNEEKVAVELSGTRAEITREIRAAWKGFMDAR